MVRPFFTAALLLAFAACGGDSSTNPQVDDTPGGNPGGGNPGGGGAQRVVEANPSYGAVIQEIWERKGCAASSCHGVSESAGLRLTAGRSYDELVNVNALQEGVRVIPNDAQNSYLVIKIEGRHRTGSRMPIGGSPLDTIDVNNIRNWIDSGAQNN